MDANDIIAIIREIGLTIAFVITAWKQVQIRNELKTMNESSIGELAEADETRRIRRKSIATRTPKETRHVAMSDERETEKE